MSSFCATSFSGFAGADPERAPHHFNERQERCLLAVGRAASRQNEGALLADALAELVQEARFAHARLGNKIDDTELKRASASARSSTSNSCSRPTKALRPRLTAASKPRRALPNGIEPIDLLRFGLALDGMFACEVRLDHPLH